MTDINFAITMALDAAESQLAARLETEFDQGAFVDTFYVREPPYLDGPAFETQFRLRRGLVASLTSVVYADTAANLSVAGQYTDVTSTVAAAPGQGDRPRLPDAAISASTCGSAIRPASPPTQTMPRAI